MGFVTFICCQKRRNRRHWGDFSGESNAQVTEGICVAAAMAKVSSKWSFGRNFRGYSVLQLQPALRALFCSWREWCEHRLLCFPWCFWVVTFEGQFFVYSSCNVYIVYAGLEKHSTKLMVLIFIFNITRDHGWTSKRRKRRCVYSLTLIKIAWYLTHGWPYTILGI